LDKGLTNSIRCIDIAKRASSKAGDERKRAVENPFLLFISVQFVLDLLHFGDTEKRY